MKKFTYLLFLAMGVTACSVESMDSTENLLVADLKAKATQDPMGFYSGPNLKGTLSVSNDCDNLYIEIIPIGEDPTDASLGVFMNGVLPQTSGGSGNISTSGFVGLESATDLVWTIPLNDATSFNIFIKAWSNWAGASSADGINQNYTAYTVDYTGCDDCDESFSYVDNEDGTYTFTYIPAEDMTDVNVVFTFAQGYVSGLESWTRNGQTMQKSMNFEACQTYTWKVGLDTRCTGEGQGKANVWTDFKVNDNSKKTSATPTIKENCPE